MKKVTTKWVLWLLIDRFVHPFPINYDGDSEREARKAAATQRGWKRLPAHATVELNRNNKT
jgi:hypothetical protein